MLTDPIADYLTRIRTALAPGHDEAAIRASGLKLEMSRILKEQGYIRDFAKEPAKVGEAIRIQLKYTQDRRPVITGLERGSPPRGPRYVNHKQVPRVFGGTGTAIVSTSTGVMTGHEAKAKGVGGEVVAYVW